MIYNQFQKNIDLLKIYLQSQIQIEIEKLALQEELYDFYRIEVDSQNQKINAIKSEIKEKLDILKKEVDVLQIEVMQPKKWYKDASTIIALFAVVFSLGTAMASYLQVESQNKRAARGELREIIQRLIALPKEDAENFNTYQDKPVVLNNLSSNINQEYILLASQAVELANRIPNDISAPEYVSIAQALISRGIKEQVPLLLDAGLKASRDINSELALLRNYGNYFFMTGDLNSGRQKYQEAMDIFSKYSASKYFIEYSNAFTELRWANSEYGQGECKRAESLLTSVSSRISNLPQGNATDNLKGEITFAQNYMNNNPQQCKP